jgi:hypothetical protein
VSTIISITIVSRQIKKSQSSMYNDKSRHIHHKHNIIECLLSNKIISIDYIKSKEKYHESINQRFVKRACV